MAGTDSVLRAMESYTKQAWVLRAWQDVFVDLVQGQLQHLYISLLSSKPPAPSLRLRNSEVCAQVGWEDAIVKLTQEHFQHLMYCPSI